MSAGFPRENLYAPGDGGMGNPVRFPNDAPLYTTADQAGLWPRVGGHGGNVLIGAVVVAALLALHEHKRVRGHWLP